jgi:hypothetical protein
LSVTKKTTDLRLVAKPSNIKNIKNKPPNNVSSTNLKEEPLEQKVVDFLFIDQVD